MSLKFKRCTFLLATRIRHHPSKLLLFSRFPQIEVAERLLSSLTKETKFQVYSSGFQHSSFTCCIPLVKDKRFFMKFVIQPSAQTLRHLMGLIETFCFQLNILKTFYGISGIICNPLRDLVPFAQF